MGDTSENSDSDEKVSNDNVMDVANCIVVPKYVMLRKEAAHQLTGMQLLKSLDINALSPSESINIEKRRQ